jgi:hypothetical protein
MYKPKGRQKVRTSQWWNRRPRQSNRKTTGMEKQIERLQEWTKRWKVQTSQKGDSRRGQADRRTAGKDNPTWKGVESQ